MELNINKCGVVIFAMMSAFLSTACLSNIDNSITQLDCQKINSDITTIEKLVDSGQYRFATNTNKDIVFSYNPEVEFKQYLKFARSVIETRNPQASRPCPIKTATQQLSANHSEQNTTQTIVDFIAPFELHNKDSKKGILLIHGLTDSPFLFHDLAAHFFDSGISVRTLLLPGHGTAASDLIDVDSKDWEQAANYGIERMLKDFDEVYLGGFSTGGALILNYLMQKESVAPGVKGTLLWAPASKANSDLIWAAGIVDYLPFVDWSDKEADIDFAKYESFPYNAAAQVHRLMKQINGSNSRTRNMQDIPLLTIVSEVDQTISSDATMSLIAEWHDPINRPNTGNDTLIYYGNKEKVTSQLPSTIKILNPVCDGKEHCKAIKGIAHTATTNSPLNPHYGQQGTYRNCNHYVDDIAAYRQCKKGENVVLGETTPANLQQNSALRRLTYNPYYSEMLAEIDAFISRTSEND